MTIRLSTAVIVVPLVALTACRCQESTEVSVETVRADAAPTSPAKEARAQPGDGPDERAQVCFEASKRASTLDPALVPAHMRTECALLFSEERCREALAGMGTGPTQQKLIDLVRTCGTAYCPGLGEPRPPLCSAKLAADDLDASLINEWARFGGAVITRDHHVPLAWARSVAGMMTGDWDLPPDPSFQLPDGGLRPPDLVAVLTPHDDATFDLVIRPAEGGEPVGSWLLSNIPRDDDVEQALERAEARVRGKVIVVRAEPGVPRTSWLRVATSLRAVGAVDLPDLAPPAPTADRAPDAGSESSPEEGEGEQPAATDAPEGDHES